MSDQETVQTQPSLTTTEIMTIILGCEQTLRFVQASPNYQQIERPNGSVHRMTSGSVMQFRRLLKFTKRL